MANKNAKRATYVAPVVNAENVATISAEYNTVNSALATYAAAETKFNAFISEMKNAKPEFVSELRKTYFENVSGNPTDVQKRDALKTALVAYGKTLATDETFLRLALGKTATAKTSTGTGAKRSGDKWTFTQNGEKITGAKACEIIGVDKGVQSGALVASKHPDLLAQHNIICTANTPAA